MSKKYLDEEDLRKEAERRHQKEYDAAVRIAEDTDDYSQSDAVEEAIHQDYLKMKNALLDPETAESWQTESAEELAAAVLDHKYGKDGIYGTKPDQSGRYNTELSVTDVAPFPAGQDPEKSNPSAFAKAATAWGVSPEVAKQMISDYYWERSKEQQAQAPAIVDAKKAMYAALADGNVAEFKRIAEMFKDNPEVSYYAAQISNELRPHSEGESAIQEGARLLADVFGRSNYNRHIDNLRNGEGEDVELNTPEMRADFGKNILLSAVKVPGKIWKWMGRGNPGALFKMAQGAIMGGGAEAARQGISGEEINPGEIAAEAAGQLGPDAFMEVSARAASKTEGGVKDAINKAKNRGEQDPDFEWSNANKRRTKDIQTALDNPTSENLMLVSEDGAKEEAFRTAKSEAQEATDRYNQVKSEVNDSQQKLDEANAKLVIDEEEGTLNLDNMAEQSLWERLNNDKKAELKKASASKTQANNKAKSKDQALKNALEKEKREREEAQKESLDAITKKRAAGKKLTQAEEARYQANEAFLEIESGKGKSFLKTRAKKEASSLLEGAGNRAKSEMGAKAGASLFNDDEIYVAPETQEDKEARWKLPGGATWEEQLTPEYKQFKLKFPRQDEGAYVEQTYAK